jgi:hypothetical protein
VKGEVLEEKGKKLNVKTCEAAGRARVYQQECQAAV